MKLIILLVILLPVVISRRKEMVTSLCHEPMKEGSSCLPKIPMYYYDPQYQMCRKFYYRGCKGNRNRFSSIEECERRCPDDVDEEEEEFDDKCTLPMAKGICHNNIMRWYYDFYTDSCKTFIYTGCLGNANNFESLFDCEEACRDEWKRKSYSG
ncbi:boophilin-H2 [Trichonephila clavata]|uniref:Boophilin-H2 n=1 Tax=Trichonephila clavata TaxID=2740835 RepID=A0A8X6GFF2_TRICU|nr:boophilin-H2 [Trichonephila clavata]